MKIHDLNRNLSDEELVEQITESKNTLLFEVLYDRYSRIVFNKCLSFSRNEAEAQDLAQDVFIRVFIGLNSFIGNSKFSTWLYALTYNHCVNYVNRNVSKKIQKNAIRWEDFDQELIESDKSSLFELKAERLKLALEHVSPEDKMILLLKYQDDFSVKELSQVLFIKKSAVKMRLKRARARVFGVYKKLELQHG